MAGFCVLNMAVAVNANERMCEGEGEGESEDEEREIGVGQLVALGEECVVVVRSGREV